MRILRALAVSAFPLLLLGGLAAVTAVSSEGCSSSSSKSTTPPSDAGSFPDVPVIDASSTALQCGLPLNDTICPSSAPCAFSGWMCAAPACDGMYVITDGQWTYYYSSDGGELVGEVTVGDASLVSCPYGFQPPTACTPIALEDCSPDGSILVDAGLPDASANGDATVVQDAAIEAGPPEAGANETGANDASASDATAVQDGAVDGG